MLESRDMAVQARRHAPLTRYVLETRDNNTGGMGSTTTGNLGGQLWCGRIQNMELCTSGAGIVCSSKLFLFLCLFACCIQCSCAGSAFQLLSSPVSQENVNCGGGTED